MEIFHFLTLITSLVLAGEALALAVGIHLVKRARGPWVCLKNDVLLAIDFLSGVVLLKLALESSTPYQSGWFLLLTSIGVITHIIRDREYRQEKENAFCFTRSLYVINLLKLFSMLALMIWGLSSASAL